jgi:hypothetical membrane protein
MEVRKTIGALLFASATQFVVLLMVAETQYPGYSISYNYISDLGVWSQASAYIFNPSVVVYGAMVLAAGYLMRTKLGWRQGALIAISGLGGIGVGFFNEMTGYPHIFFALLAFVGGSMAGLTLRRRLKGVMGWFGVAIGLISLLALILLGTGIWLGLGAGGMERMVFYPQSAFILALGGYFMAGTPRDEK